MFNIEAQQLMFACYLPGKTRYGYIALPFRYIERTLKLEVYIDVLEE